MNKTVEFSKLADVGVSLLSCVAIAGLGAFVANRMFERQQLAYIVILLLYSYALLQAANTAMIKQKISEYTGDKQFAINRYQQWGININIGLGIIFYSLVIAELVRVAVTWAF